MICAVIDSRLGRILNPLDIVEQSIPGAVPRTPS